MKALKKKKVRGAVQLLLLRSTLPKDLILLLDRSPASPADSVDVAASHFITKNCETAMLQFWIWQG